MRNLILVLGDQLDHKSAVFDDFDSDSDVIWMAEVQDEATHVWCHKLRIASFLSAMRHFRDELQKKGHIVEYHELQKQASKDRGRSFDEILRMDIKRLRPDRLAVVQPGERVFKRSCRIAQMTSALNWKSEWTDTSTVRRMSSQSTLMAARVCCSNTTTAISGRSTTS